MASSKLALPAFAKRAASQTAPMIAIAIVALFLLWLIAGMPFKSELAGMLGWKEEEGQGASLETVETPGTKIEGPVLTLSEERLKTSHIELTKVVRRRIRPETMAPARVDFDATRRLALVAPVDCVVQQVLVEPGAAVKKGDRLIFLQSADVGVARDEISKCEDDLKLANREVEYARDILANVQQLLSELAKSPDYDSVVKSLEGKRLGVHREHLLSAYSKLNLARKTVEESSDLGATGGISGRLVQQRKSEREVAAAAFDSQCETTLFECLQEKDRTAAAAARAVRLLEIAKSNLAALLGGLQVESPSEESKNLSELVVIAPIDGRLDAQPPVRYARLKAGDALLTITDASKLWITANVREREWSASKMKADDAVRVKIPALGSREFSSKVRFIGAQVAPETRTLPIILEIDNAEGQLKPGMSAWASLAVEEERDALLVPTAAIMRHEEQPFLFVGEGPNRFRRVDVELGYEGEGETEVKSGVKESDQVVTKGAFLLKSELLLEKEE